MAIRVTANEVIEILTDSPDTYPIAESVVETFIGIANRTVDDVFSDDTETGEAILKDIEMFYAAHLIASSDLDRRTIEEKIDDAAVKYQMRSGTGLDSTGYGQVVRQLDPTGRMSNLSKKAASMRAIKQYDD